MGCSASRSQIPQATKQTVYCQTHPRNSVTHFCKETNELLCLYCYRIRIRRLSARTIVDVNTYIESSEFIQTEEKTIRSIGTRKDALKIRCYEAEHTKRDFIQKRETLKRNVNELVENIISSIRHLEEDMSTMIDLTFQPVIDVIEENLKTMKSNLENVKEIEEKFGKPNDKIVKLQDILRAKSITDSIPDTGRRRLPRKSVKLKLNKRLTLKQILGEGIMLGDIMVKDADIDGESLVILSDESEGEESSPKRPSTPKARMPKGPLSEASTDHNKTPRNVSVHSRKDSEAPRASVHSIKTPSGIGMTQPMLDWESYFEIPRAPMTRNITDSIELGDGRLVLCDQRNKQLLLFSSSLELADTRKLMASPHNMTCVATNRIAITLPEENFIMMVDIVGNIFMDSKENTPAIASCRGITKVNRQICYTSQNSVYLKEDGESKKIAGGFTKPVSLITGNQQGEMFVCCLGNKSRGQRGEIVTVNTATHETVCTLSNEHIGQPVSCTLDAAGNLFVCDIQAPPSIHVINKGQYSHRVLESDGEKFQHIRYLGTRDEFLITENDSNCIGFYRLKHVCIVCSNFVKKN